MDSRSRKRITNGDARRMTGISGNKRKKKSHPRPLLWKNRLNKRDWKRSSYLRRNSPTRRKNQLESQKCHREGDKKEK